MATASTGPRRGGRRLPRVTRRLRASRPRRAQLAPTSSKSLLCDSLADGCDSAQQGERKEEEEEEDKEEEEEGVGEAGDTTFMDAPCPSPTGSAGRALFSRGVTDGEEMQLR